MLPKNWPPPWIKLGPRYTDAKGLPAQDITIRWWHPGLWWAILKTIRVEPGPRLYVWWTRFWELALDLTLALSGWVARRYARVVEGQARRLAIDAGVWSWRSDG